DRVAHPVARLVGAGLRTRCLAGRAEHEQEARHALRQRGRQVPEAATQDLAACGEVRIGGEGSKLTDGLAGDKVGGSPGMREGGPLPSIRQAEALLELEGQTRLADARLSDQAHRASPALARALPGLAERGQLGLPPAERREPASERGLEPGDDGALTFEEV